MTLAGDDILGQPINTLACVNRYTGIRNAITGFGAARLSEIDIGMLMRYRGFGRMRFRILRDELITLGVLDGTWKHVTADMAAAECRVSSVDEKRPIPRTWKMPEVAIQKSIESLATELDGLWDRKGAYLHELCRAARHIVAVEAEVLAVDHRIKELKAERDAIA